MSGRPTTTGVLPLVRLVLRRDRVRLPIWIVSITLLVLFTAASVKSLYKTEAELVAGAAPMYGNAAVIALNGPTYAIDTYGGQMVFQVGSFGYVVVALMGMFLVGRHTRADEEDGRTELIRATVVGRNAPVTAALVVAAMAYILLGGLITLSMLSQDVGAEGSILFGVAMGSFGMFFACLTAVTAQVTEHNRAALGLAGVTLGASYVLRAIGDVSGGRVVVAVADGVGTVHQAVRRGSVAAAARPCLRVGGAGGACLPPAGQPGPRRRAAADSARSADCRAQPRPAGWSGDPAARGQLHRVGAGPRSHGCGLRIGRPGRGRSGG